MNDYKSIKLLCAIFFFLILSFVRSKAFLRPNKTNCLSETLMNLTNIYKLKKNSLAHEGLLFSFETVRWFNDLPISCICELQGCLPICCSKNCSWSVNNTKNLLNIFESDSRLPFKKTKFQDMWLFPWDPCPGYLRYALEPNSSDAQIRNIDQFHLLSNGSVYHPTISLIRNYSDYCIYMDTKIIEIHICLEISINNNKWKLESLTYILSVIISELFLTTTFIVYALLPQLHNVPGKNLCCYIVCLMIAFLANLFIRFNSPDEVDISTCITFGMLFNLHKKNFLFNCRQMF